MHIYKRLDRANIDGLVLSACVQMQSLPSIAKVQAESGVPTLSPAVATTWQMLKKLDLPAQIPNCGELLSGKHRARRVDAL
jgi:maleate isomerase